MTIQTLFGAEEIPTKQRCMIGHCPLSLSIKDKGCPPKKTSLYSMGLLTGNHSYSSTAPTALRPYVQAHESNSYLLRLVQAEGSDYKMSLKYRDHVVLVEII